MGNTLLCAQTLAVVLIWNMADSPAVAQLCDLGPVVLPNKPIQLNLDGIEWPAIANGRLAFARKDDLYDVTETVTATIGNASSFVSMIISKEVGSLPNDRCGSIAIVHDSQVSAAAGSLQIRTEVSAQQWGCVIGVAALLAEGDLGYVTNLTPTVQAGKLSISTGVAQNGDLTTTVPDFDSDLTASIQEQLRSASGAMTDTIKEAVAKLQARLEQAIAQTQDPTEPLRPLYAPRLMTVAFQQQATSILLIHVRQALAREGTACKIHELAAQKWAESN
jgi:hypothetical protein